MAASLSVAIVTYRTPTAVLETALRSLAASIDLARSSGVLGRVSVHVVDNSDGGDIDAAKRAVATWPGTAGEIALHTGHGNIGYGRANNLVLERLDSDLHVAMNPDVELAADTLRAAIEAMRDHPEVGLLAPDVRGEDGERQFLCKRYPSVGVLFLRGFAPAALRERYRHVVDSYEMRDRIGDTFVSGIPLASGCFMLVRTALFRKLGGFDPRFFMYFEDYDLSVRLAREAVVAYAPQARIVHHGGEAARKGMRHIAWFVASAWRFFSRHGWRF